MSTATIGRTCSLDRRSRLIEALPVLDCLGGLGVLQEISREFEEDLLDLARGGVEELAPLVDPIDPSIGKPGVHFGLQADRVRGEHERVGVVFEWDRCVAKLADTLSRVESAR